MYSIHLFYASMKIQSVYALVAPKLLSVILSDCDSMYKKNKIKIKIKKSAKESSEKIHFKGDLALLLTTLDILQVSRDKSGVPLPPTGPEVH